MFLTIIDSAAKGVRSVLRLFFEWHTHLPVCLPLQKNDTLLIKINVLILESRKVSFRRRNVRSLQYQGYYLHCIYPDYISPLPERMD